MGYQHFNPAVIMPTFNNARTLPGVIEAALKLPVPIFVIDDGSSDSTPQILQQFASRIQTVRHARNRGKAAALRSGFAAARAAGFTHAITIDTDGQLNPTQIPHFLERAQNHPQSLIVGVRDENSADYPRSSRIGRRVSNFLVHLQSGLKIFDSQCGFRCYPLDFLQNVDCKAERFGFETEIMTRAGWAHCPIEEIHVTCHYKLPEGRVTHFCPWLDSFRAAAMHVRLLFRAFFPWPHPQWPIQKNSQKKNWLQWLNPKEVWREMLDGHTGRWRIALSIAVGVWIANWPVYPCQTLAALYTSRRLHLNPLATVLGSQASTPPMNFLLIAMCISFGHFLLHGTSAAISWNEIHTAHLWQFAAAFAIDWIVGGFIFGFILGAAVFGLLLTLFACIPFKRRENLSPALPALPHPSQGG
ncbi:MAG TPA: DUF2062 domain-containing protein [Tepidisphaeraceae bacterium]